MKANIGLIGLAVMGENLALNMESKGFTVAVYNRSVPGEEGVVDRFINGRGKSKRFIGTHSIEQLVDSVKSPHIIMMMVKAGHPVDELISQLLPFLSPGDVIIDGGNSDFHDTERRVKELEKKGIYFVGTGISGGEEGALHGPSVMPGGAVMEGIKTIFPDCETLLFPIADGGEGMLDILTSATKGKYRTLPAHGPLMELVQGRYGISGDGQTALIEMAAVSGLPLVPEDKRNPMLTTTYGTGELILDALEQGCRHFIVGIGGSATNDAGLGMLQALGFRFLDKRGNLLGTGGRIMSQVASIDTSAVHPALKEARFTIACDVRNPFCGSDGAAYVFASQKGADAKMVKELDTGMQALSRVILSTTGKDISDIPGAGAAGGMGGGFLAFLNAELKPGIRLMLDVLDFGKRITGADLIFTGEGRADRQTVMGKVPSGILEEARKQNIPVIVLAGSIEDAAQMNRAGFQGIFSITPGPVTMEKAMEPEFARENIRRLVTQICSVIHPFATR